jgi:ParB-like chromosome segregation protein Spo0J
MVKDLELAKIRIDGGTQPRTEINQDAIAEHRDGYELGEHRPPLDVFYDGAEYWLADGFHRWHGATAAKLETHPCTIHRGTQRDAILFSVGANAKHGLKRTNDDKRKAVLILLNDEEWGKKSQRWIAEKCGVSHQFVANMQGALSTVDNAPPRIVETKDGRQYPATRQTDTEEQQESQEPPSQFDPEDFDPKMNPELPPTEVDTTKPIAERIKEQQQIVERFARGLTKWFEDNIPTDPWLDDSRVDIARDQVKSAASSLRLCKAHGKPCPKCDGAGCAFCKDCGYLPKNSYEMAGGK